MAERSPTRAVDRPVDLWDPDWFLGDDTAGAFAELRRTDPVHWQEMPGEAGYWAVLRYADAVEVARHPETYSSWLGSIMIEDPASTTPVMRESERGEPS